MDDENSRRPRAGAEPGGLSPVRAFVLLTAIAMALAGGIAAATREAPAPEPGVETRSSPDYSLTDAEAIAEFERLNDQLMQAYRERNIALAEDVFTSDSPMLPRVRKEIAKLLRTSIVSRSRFDEISTTVKANEGTAISIARVEILYPRFETESGRQASRSVRPERVRVEWDLRVEQGRWLLHDALVVDRRILGRAG